MCTFGCVVSEVCITKTNILKLILCYTYHEKIFISLINTENKFSLKFGIEANHIALKAI